jgi:ATP synthase protein I
MRYTFSALRGAKESNAVLRALSRPIRTVLAWQFAVTAAMALAAWLLADPETALSAAAGGAVSMLAGLASALVASLGKAKCAGGVLVGALRAEAVKISLALLLLWLVLANYAEVVVGVFLGVFVVTMVVFSMAFFVREY